MMYGKESTTMSLKRVGEWGLMFGLLAVIVTPIAIFGIAALIQGVAKIPFAEE